MKKYFSILLALFSITANAQISLADIPLKDLNNQSISLNQYKGKDVYVKVWASWCPFCLAGLADIDKLSAEKGKNFEVITLVSPTHRGEKPTEKFIQWYKGLEYKNITVLLDEKGEIIKRARIRGYPSSIILDKDLNIKKSQAGHLTNEQIEQFFQ
ncbi:MULTISPECIES: redoxin family protein [Pasteurellaceae]|uniref:Redoxin family protein n=1 Tax=Pasteurella atlantica TaxID=2827233 RepID=A0AAW8CR06_9PAST|nr:redoxin family protein [Pasteurella atlantica]MBR0573423.1 redoxin family protein [Pasteurella atlantica]MDP8039770.1 redoxin family protein [Pasteurella atlantica]MDP8041787.1 redoxin family protein [Pasteurella atlantica]MDP8043854.1 redoxin family protein [Pasteurella atlantica]MDP8046143.1 redoxin family protein [Pasteurella atlantica]